MARSTQRHQSPQIADPPLSVDSTLPKVTSSASLSDIATNSDTDGGEKPVREQLKKTSIASLHKSTTLAADISMRDRHNDEKGSADGSSAGDEESQANNEADRGRVQKKRSYDDLEGDNTDEKGERHEKHTRKKSRDMKTGKESPVTPPGESDQQWKQENKIISPKNKRNRDEYLEDEEHNGVASPDNASETQESTELANTTDPKRAAEPVSEEPKPKRHRDSGSPQPANSTDGKTTESKASSGFSNVSAVSPFAALSGNKPPTPEPQTSASAFAASGFSALASSSTSPFSNLGSPSSGAQSPFGALSGNSKPTSTSFGGTTSSSSSFGGALGSSEKSPFASIGAAPLGTGASSFAKLGSGIGGGFGALSGSKLSTFASPGGGSGIVGLKDKPAKPFGTATAAEDEEDESSGEDEDKRKDAKSPAPEDDEQDERFYQQAVETGEENEDTIITAKAKVYNFTKAADGRGEWKERGFGMLKINVVKKSTDSDGNDAPPKARFVMRAHGTNRVVLNSPIQKELKVGDVKGQRPINGSVLFMGTLNGSSTLETLQIKMKLANAQELWDKITDLQSHM